MKRLALLFLSIILFSLDFYAQKYELPIDAAHSVVSFSVGFAGGISSIDGRFDNYNGVIGYHDQNDRSSLYCNVTIDATSINTGNKMRDKDLNGAGWFNTEEYPEITFESTGSKKTDKGYVITGDFTMMGITEEISIPFEYQHDQDIVFVFGEPRIAALGTYRIDRTEYGIPKRGFDNIVPSLGTMALLKEVDVKLMVMGRGPGIGGLISSAIKSDGVGKALEKYEMLEKEHEGKNTYAFGEMSLAGIASQLVRGGMNDEAVEVGSYMIKRYPGSAVAHYTEAAALDKTGNREGAIKGYKKALALNPEFGRAKQALEKLMEE